MKLGTIIELPDGRIGTICWNHLDGSGGVWGRHDFSGVSADFSDDLPAPEFMLREKSIEQSLRNSSHRSDLECVGEDYAILRTPGEGGK